DWKGGNRFREQAKEGADTCPETANVDAPPDHADYPSGRVLVGLRATEEAAYREKDDAADPETDSDPVEPAVDRLLRFPLRSGDGGTAYLPSVAGAQCTGHQVLLRWNEAGGQGSWPRQVPRRTPDPAGMNRGRRRRIPFLGRRRPLPLPPDHLIKEPADGQTGAILSKVFSPLLKHRGGLTVMAEPTDNL